MELLTFVTGEEKNGRNWVVLCKAGEEMEVPMRDTAELVQSTTTEPTPMLKQAVSPAVPTVIDVRAPTVVP